MSKNTKNYMLGVAFGFVGMILYTFSLMGYENIMMNDVLHILKQSVLPFLFTEMWVVLAAEGFRNLRSEFVKFKEKLNKKNEEGAEA